MGVGACTGNDSDNPRTMWGIVLARGVVLGLRSPYANGEQAMCRSLATGVLLKPRLDQTQLRARSVRRQVRPAVRGFVTYQRSGATCGRRVGTRGNRRPPLRDAQSQLADPARRNPETPILAAVSRANDLYISRPPRGRRAYDSAGGFESMNARTSWSRFSGSTSSLCTEASASRVSRNCCR